jgi:hypothetical protein
VYVCVRTSAFLFDLCLFVLRVCVCDLCE